MKKISLFRKTPGP